MTLQRDIAIEAKDLHVSFLIQKHGINNFKDFLFSMGISKPFERKQVLKGLDLEIYKGECFGVMGRNGSGKSTFLRTVAGIMPVEKGELHVNGKVAPMMALGVGFEPELTGFENIKLLGVMMGKTRKQIANSVDVIQEFSELTTDELEMQVKRYSAGMMARLAFSITVADTPDILIVDEALSVGDIGFREKSANRITEIQNSDATIVYVSHNLNELRRICTRGCYLENGKVALVGDIEDVISLYLEKNTKRRTFQKSN